MGQRHQIYVYRKFKDRETNKAVYQCIGAFHHQWCYGLKASTDLVRLALAALNAKVQGIDPSKAEWSDYYLYDPREVETLVKAIYGICPEEGTVSIVHNDAEYLIKDGVAYPELGDNNDGCGMIVIDDVKKEVRACLFTPGHLEGEFDTYKKWTVYTPKQYFDFYYRGDDAVKMLEGNTARAKALEIEVKPVTQAEFNKIFKASIQKPKSWNVRGTLNAVKA